MMTTKERPILFSAPMVRAILEGQKTQTRRVIRCACNTDHLGRLLGTWSLSTPPYQYDGIEKLWNWSGGPEPKAGDWIEEYQTDVDDNATAPVRCPYGVPGERLWVRETFCPDWSNDPIYRADEPTMRGARDAGYAAEPRWRPSIHMPRWASRIDLEVIGVRVERLQEISEADARSEGVDAIPQAPAAFTHRTAFAGLWDKINGKRSSWELNPWVWVIEFQKIQEARPCSP